MIVGDPFLIVVLPLFFLKMKVFLNSTFSLLFWRLIYGMWQILKIMMTPNHDNNNSNPPLKNTGRNRNDHNNGNGKNAGNCVAPNREGFIYNSDGSRGFVGVDGSIGSNRLVQGCNDTNIGSTTMAPTIATNKMNINIGRYFNPYCTKIDKVFALIEDLSLCPPLLRFLLLVKVVVHFCNVLLIPLILELQIPSLYKAKKS